MPGIYKITSPSNKVYIGQTVNINQRRKQYKNISHSSVINQTKLVSSLRKYGWNNHIFEVIHELPKDVSQSTLNEYEVLYYLYYKDLGINMMNIKFPGSNGNHSEETKIKIGNSNRGNISPYLGIPRTSEIKNKIRDAQTGKNSHMYGKYSYLHHNSKKVIQLTVNNEYIKEWICARDVYRELGISYKHISSVCKGIRNSAGGYIWKFKTN